MTESLEVGLAKAMQRSGLTGAIANLRQLSGGANLDSWLFDCGDTTLVLRRAPSVAWDAQRPLGLKAEAGVLRAAVASGVRAPRIVVELEPDDGVGLGFVMECISGTADPAVVLADPSPQLIIDLAQDLARIHAVDIERIAVLPRLTTAEMVEDLAAQFEDYGANRPIVALGFAWLRANLPAREDVTLIHGDFRIGNVMVDQGRISGVLDWEMAHAGDFHEDLAFGCMTVWRFGHIDKPAFGCADLDSFFAAYEAASGRTVDRERFRFWLVFRTVWWALGCLQMGKYWREGAARILERTVISRRTSEQELDLLLLLEEDAPEAERGRPLPAATEPLQDGVGEASASEILTAISEWLAGTIKPKLTPGRERFDLAVAQNALGIVRRQLAGRPVPEDKALADEILAGTKGLATPGLLASLKRKALDTLAADMPKYAALAEARREWEG